MLAAVTGKITLSVSFEVQPPGCAASLNRMLPDGSVHGLAAPLDILRQTDVDREQSRHESASPDQTNFKRPRYDGRSTEFGSPPPPLL
jgi:hypothetical protein